MPSSILFTICFSELYGSQQSIISLASSLDPGRYVPIISAPESEEFRAALTSKSIAFEPLPFADKLDFTTILGIRKILKKHNVSVIHANLGISSILSVAAAKIPPRFPVIITRHITDDRYTTINNPIKYAIYKTMYEHLNRYSTFITFPSESTKNSIIKRERGAETKGVVIPNGVFTSEYSNPPQDAAAFRKRFGIPETAFVVASISRLSEEKQVDILIKTASIIYKQHPEFRFIVAGEGDLRKPFENLIKENNLTNIFFLPGYLEEIKSLLNSADLYAHCCPIESFGISIIEAMASGTPVVCAKGGAPMEIISDGVDGVFFEPGNASDLAVKILNLKNCPSAKLSIKENALKTAANYDMEKIASRYMALYDATLGVVK